jgi:hypothetical protein
MADFITIPLHAALGPADTDVADLAVGMEVYNARDPEYYGVGTIRKMRDAEYPDGVRRERRHAEFTVDWGTETTTEPEWNLLPAQPALKFGAVKTAISLPDLVRQTNAFSKKYRGGCQARLLDSNPKALFLHYNVKCNKEDSDPAGHDVRVQFDVSKVQESQQAKDLDIQVQCSCPAFLYWGAQWNLHQRDGLLGPSRPLLQAPTERLDLRGNFVICKHIHAVFERILPSVQHNIVKILREREKERKKDELDKTPERLEKEQEQMRKRKEVEKIRKTKNKEIQDKLLEALRKQEEARMLHEEDLEDQGAGPEADEVERTEPATEVKPRTMGVPNESRPTPTTLPEESEQQELEDIGDLTTQEEQKIEQLHKEHKPHEHKGLPYEEEEEGEGWQGERLSSVVGTE